MGLRAKLLHVVLSDLPDPTSTINQDSSRFDLLLGGKLGAGRWRYFSTGYGTTCGQMLDGWLADAGAPAELINEETEDGGSGFGIGESISRLVNGAKKLGWLRTPKQGELPAIRPGDAYLYKHPIEHVGVVVRVTPVDDKTLEVETADGGQGTLEDQKGTRSVRTFRVGTSGHAVDIQSPYNSGWLENWIAIGGDEEDSDASAVASGEGLSGLSGTTVLIAAGIAGFAIMLAGLAVYAKPNWGGKAVDDALARLGITA